MKRISFFFAINSVLIVLMVSGAARSDVWISEGTFDQLTIFPQGVRSIGMSGAGGADGSASATGFFNPAGVAWMKGLALHMGFGESLWMQDHSEYALSLGRGFAPYGDENGWKLAGRLSWVRAAAGQGYLCCLEPGEDDYYLSGTAAIGRKQGVAEIALGGAVRYVEHRDRYYYHVWSYDLGTILALNFDRGESVRFRPRIGASVRNLGPDIEYWNHYYSWEPLRRYSYDQPQRRRVGAGFDVAAAARFVKPLGREAEPFGFSVDWDYIDTGHSKNVMWALGAEASVFETLHLRAGYGRYAFPDYRESTTLGVGLSAVYGWADLRFDYAALMNSGVGFSRTANQFSITLCTRAMPFCPAE